MTGSDTDVHHAAQSTLLLFAPATMPKQCASTSKRSAEDNMPNWTSGPWAVCDVSAMPVEIRARKAIVARIASGSRDRDADARLIAAAPDLYAALQAIFDEVAPGKRPQSADSWLPEPFVEAARAALAKARGETS